MIFNLVINGYCLVDEISDDEWQICIPHSEGHSYKVGPVITTPKGCDKVLLRDLTPGDSHPRFDCIKSGDPMRRMIDADEDLVLNKKFVRRVADNDFRNIITIPKPTAVRSYRAVLLEANKKVIGDQNQYQYAFNGNPRVIHETLVLHYKEVPEPFEVTFGTETFLSGNEPIFNLSLFSQEPPARKKSGETSSSPTASTMAHEEELNNLLVFDNEKPTINLTQLGSPAPAQDDPEIGVKACDMSRLADLYSDLTAQADGVACGKGFMAR